MTVDNALPLFLFVYWACAGTAYRWWRRWKGRPVRRLAILPMMVFPALWLMSMLIGVLVSDAFPKYGAWAVIGVHIFVAIVAVSYSMMVKRA